MTDLELQIEGLLLKHELIKATDIQEFKFGSNRPITLADDIKELVEVREQAAAEKAVREELTHWAAFFRDPSMNAVPPSERLEQRLAALEEVENEQSR